MWWWFAAGAATVLAIEAAILGTAYASARAILDQPMRGEIEAAIRSPDHSALRNP